MTRDETKKLMMMMQVSYPNFKVDDKTATVNVWTMALGDFDYKYVEMAFMSYLRTNTSGFAPAPGQLIEIIRNICKPEELTDLEAWSLVRKAISNSGYNSVDEFSKLPEHVKRAVGSPGQLRNWALDSEYNEQVASSNFMRTYRALSERRAERDKYPENVKALMDRVNCGSDTQKLIESNRKMVEERTTSIDDGYRESEIMSENIGKKLGELMDDLRKS